MKRTTFALALFMTLLFTVMSGTKLAQVAYAPSDGLPYKPPVVTVLSPSPNGTYNVPDVPLNVTIQIFGQTPQSLERLNSVNYSLDGQPDVPISFAYPSSYGPGYYLDGNGTLSGLSDGIHNVTVRGETTIGAENKDFNATVSFTVDTSTTTITEPFPTTLVVATIASVAVIGIGLLVYFKKFKKISVRAEKTAHEGET